MGFGVFRLCKKMKSFVPALVLLVVRVVDALVCVPVHVCCREFLF